MTVAPSADVTMPEPLVKRKSKTHRYVEDTYERGVAHAEAQGVTISFVLNSLLANWVESEDAKADAAKARRRGRAKPAPVVDDPFA